MMKLLLISLLLVGCGGSSQEDKTTFDSTKEMASLINKIKAEENGLVID